MLSRDIHEVFRKYKSDRQIFHDMMPLRTREILLVASPFDAFTLEQDGLLSEVIFGGYFQLNLSNPPRITNVSSGEEALARLQARPYDLIIVMSRLGQSGHLELAQELRQAAPKVPVFLLLNDNVEVGILDQRRQEFARTYDGIFVWNGHSEIFVAMIKLMEDRANVENDTAIGLTRVILLVEDSIRYHSRYLPILYSEIMQQTRRLASEQNVDGMTRMLRMRARPKVLLATTYEEALACCERYQDYLLCLITDRKFPKDGVMDSQAGIKLIQAVRALNPDLPTLLQSSDPDKEAWATALDSRFLNKNSPTLGAELSGFFYESLGFGDFVFRTPEGEEIARAANLEELREHLRTIPAESLVNHALHNHFSAWLMARGEIQIAQVVLKAKPSDFEDAEGLRAFLLSAGDYVQRIKSKGKVVPFSRSALPDPHNILRLGDGALGGKARGIAFANHMLAHLDLEERLPEVNVRIPRSAVIGTDEFSEFLTRNGLQHSLQEQDDADTVKRRFLMGELSPQLMERLRTLLEEVRQPLAVRSSGLLEDALSHPFAGLYRTYFLPNHHPDLSVRLTQLAEAIKLVYASVYAKEARAYFQAIDYKIEEERMGILIQELAGRTFGDRFYPHISGVAQSYNYYPVAYLQPEDGIAVLGVGLGTYVVGGEQAFRFCPAYPQLDMVNPSELLKASQRHFYALDLARDTVDLFRGEDATLARLDIAEAERDGALTHCAAVWDADDQRIREGLDRPGLRIVNFMNVVKYDQMPLARVLRTTLDLVREAMETPVELEFAVDLEPAAANGKPTFYLLQIKHQLQDSEDGSLGDVAPEDPRLLLLSDRCVGNGVLEGLQDVVWIDPAAFDKTQTPDLAEALERLNDRFRAENRRYLLLGPGRWGSRDRYLGIPVTWPAISCARLIVEYALPDFQVDASLGSHFFHNVTALNIGYCSVPHGGSGSRIDWDWLRALPVAAREGAVVHTRLDQPLRILMDGRRGACAAFKA